MQYIKFIGSAELSSESTADSIHILSPLAVLCIYANSLQTARYSWKDSHWSCITPFLRIIKKASLLLLRSTHVCRRIHFPPWYNSNLVKRQLIDW